MIENHSYESYVTMEGDTTGYYVKGFDPNIMLPNEDVYKPKKAQTKKNNGLEDFMESKD